MSTFLFVTPKVKSSIYKLKAECVAYKSRVDLIQRAKTANKIQKKGSSSKVNTIFMK